jgi:hypothetical protein
MRSGGDQRPRGRPYVNRPSQPRQGAQQGAQNFTSNGPGNSYGTGGRVRGDPHQLYQRYLALAQDAARGEDRIAAEGYYQRAEHYFRVSNAARDGYRADGQPAEAAFPIHRNIVETGGVSAKPGEIDALPYAAEA